MVINLWNDAFSVVGSNDYLLSLKDISEHRYFDLVCKVIYSAVINILKIFALTRLELRLFFALFFSFLSSKARILLPFLGERFSMSPMMIVKAYGCSLCGMERMSLH